MVTVKTYTRKLPFYLKRYICPTRETSFLSDFFEIIFLIFSCVFICYSLFKCSAWMFSSFSFPAHIYILMIHLSISGTVFILLFYRTYKVYILQYIAIKIAEFRFLLQEGYSPKRVTVTLIGKRNDPYHFLKREDAENNILQFTVKNKKTSGYLLKNNKKSKRKVLKTFISCIILLFILCVLFTFAYSFNSDLYKLHFNCLFIIGTVILFHDFLCTPLKRFIKI